jgi:LmbE family N-acetylglucosaminyl deacetylase
MIDARSVAVIVAHPDDEILWAGGLMLAHPEWQWLIVTLCRASDTDRAPRFFRTIQHFHANGAMADLDDGPEQIPQDPCDVQETLLRVLQARLSAPSAQGSAPLARSQFAPLSSSVARSFDLVLTHGPRGEYTRHRRHEETCRAVVDLWAQNKIATGALWMFAYEDGGRAYCPRAVADAHLRCKLSDDLWLQKYDLITQVYGFAPDSWEARTTPHEEAFWCFGTATAAVEWSQQMSSVQ